MATPPPLHHNNRSTARLQVQRVLRQHNKHSVKDERRGPDGDWVGEWVEPGGGWVPNYVRINLRGRYIHEMGGDNSSKLAKQLCRDIGATIATIYSEEEDELAYAASQARGLLDRWKKPGVPDYLSDAPVPSSIEKCPREQVRAGVPCYLTACTAVRFYVRFGGDAARTGANLDQHVSWGAQVCALGRRHGRAARPHQPAHRRRPRGRVAGRWSNGRAPEAHAELNRLQGQPDNGKLKGAIAASLHAIDARRLQRGRAVQRAACPATSATPTSRATTGCGTTCSVRMNITPLPDVAQ